ncbi:MAG: CBS domain-containing protein [Gemmatimonadetes bacterium]|nr:CBS domain-containing protein [Gemmatimonadota bacterium]
MRLAELLSPTRIKLGLSVGSVAEAVALLLQEEGGALPELRAVEERLRRAHAGEAGSLRRVSPSTLVLSLGPNEDEDATAALGVAAHPLFLLESDGSEGPGPRILLVLVTPRAEEMRGDALENLARVLGDSSVESRILAATSPEKIRSSRRLMRLELTEALRVEHVMVRMSYRIFPDTPLREVVELMARKGLQALPVVGEDLHLVGVVTAGDALRHALDQKGRGGVEPDGRWTATARDVMLRSVMCVPEDQDLLDAAQLMVNKNVAELPVVRDGEVVGILTRDRVLGALFGGK